MPLYDSDIISAKLYAVAKNKGCSDTFSKCWKELIQDVNNLKALRVADIDSILMQKMYYTRAVNKEVVSDSGAVNVTTPGLRRYYTEINRDILNDPIELCKGMINLVQIWKKVLAYPIVQVLLKFNENSKLFLACYFYRFMHDDITEEILQPIIEGMLRLFAVLELVDTGYSSKYFKTFLFGEAVKLADKNITPEVIKEDFHKHILSSWKKDNIREEILDYDRNALVYLNEYLFARETNRSFILSDAYDIEHIMPNSGNNLPTIRSDAEIANEDEFRFFVNKLGNKILLEQKINRAIGNEWFRTKVSTELKDKTGYINSTYPIACALVEKYKSMNQPYWTKHDIKIATDEVADRIVKFIFGE